jgi:hypothetical protein
MPRAGALAEWLGRGLQSLVRRFESARRLRRGRTQVLPRALSFARSLASLASPAAGRPERAAPAMSVAARNHHIEWCLAIWLRWVAPRAMVQMPREVDGGGRRRFRCARSSITQTRAPRSRRSRCRTRWPERRSSCASTSSRTRPSPIRSTRAGTSTTSSSPESRASRDGRMPVGSGGPSRPAQRGDQM